MMGPGKCISFQIVKYGHFSSQPTLLMGYVIQLPQDPLISPNYVARMADIFGFDVKTQGVKKLMGGFTYFFYSYPWGDDPI